MVAIAWFKPVSQDEKQPPIGSGEHHLLARDIFSSHHHASKIGDNRACTITMLLCMFTLVGVMVYMLMQPINPSQGFPRFHKGEKGIQSIAKEYIAYTEKYNKSYATSQESLKRLNAYYTTEENIVNWNKQKEHGSTVYGHNDMSDWTDAEFEKTLLPKSFYQRLHKDAEYIVPVPESLAGMIGERAGPLPDFFDWRDRNVVTPVKAQGQCGSCWAFASTATVEAAYAIAHGERRNLSEQTLLDCDLVDNACDGGDEDKAFRYIHRQGLAYSVDLPYVAHRQNNCVVNDHWNTTRIKAAYFLHHDEDSIINWLVNFGPVNIGMSVIQPMRAYKGGVFTPSEYACKNEVIGLHALLITGYGTSDKGEKYWIVKNSWGNTWGVEHGYIYFARGINACGIEDEPIGILA
ncbi:hypothetical protein GCK72_023566 [Caenorhabditis remanei]|uniref:Peptidase C1A papain C-terminal domain-containing protein n=1 Tax=Caenorhabditis remanei TaxID=31234 RepID=E3M2T8_CAERE|nr:hypothetical protein GCK72_023566 [Caenorhabditis remanei]EFO89849.1 hypothetical protein CRE_07390 [Caenorhabditis remanei]KAF1747107.1 hypothetical protein GCK72_023566 [Caenorhabditis remanei]